MMFNHVQLMFLYCFGHSLPPSPPSPRIDPSEIRDLQRRLAERARELGPEAAARRSGHFWVPVLGSGWRGWRSQKVVQDFGHSNMFEPKGPKASSVKLGARGVLQTIVKAVQEIVRQHGSVSNGFEPLHEEPAFSRKQTSLRHPPPFSGCLTLKGTAPSSKNRVNTKGNPGTT